MIYSYKQTMSSDFLFWNSKVTIPFDEIVLEGNIHWPAYWVVDAVNKDYYFTVTKDGARKRYIRVFLNLLLSRQEFAAESSVVVITELTSGFGEVTAYEDVWTSPYCDMENVYVTSSRNLQWMWRIQRDIEIRAANKMRFKIYRKAPSPDIYLSSVGTSCLIYSLSPHYPSV